MLNYDVVAPCSMVRATYGFIGHFDVTHLVEAYRLRAWVVALQRAQLSCGAMPLAARMCDWGVCCPSVLLRHLSAQHRTNSTRLGAWSE